MGSWGRLRFRVLGLDFFRFEEVVWNLRVRGFYRSNCANCRVLVLVAVGILSRLVVAMPSALGRRVWAKV